MVQEVASTQMPHSRQAWDKLFLDQYETLSHPALYWTFSTIKKSDHLSASNEGKKGKKTKQKKDQTHHTPHLKMMICNVQSFPSKAEGFAFQFRIPMGRPCVATQQGSTCLQHVHTLRPFVQDFQTSGSNSRSVTAALTKLLDPRKSWTNSQTPVILCRSFWAADDNTVGKGWVDSFLTVLGRPLQLGSV